MKIYKKNVLFYAIIFSLMPIALEGRLAIVSYIIDCIKLITICFGGLLLIKKIMLRKLASIVLLFLFSSIWLGISTWVNGGNLFSCITYSYILFALIVLEYLCEDNSIQFISLSEKGIRYFILLNLLFMVLYPEGIYHTSQDRYHYVASIRVNLLGYDNQLSAVLIPYMGLVTFLYHYNRYNLREKRKMTIMVCAIILTMVLSTSSTLKIIGGAFGVMFCVVKYGKRIFSFKAEFKIILCVVFLIVFIQKYDIFSFFITDVLGKSMSLSNRTYIWTEAIKLIKDNFLTGLGLIGTDNYIFLPMSADYRSAHDMYLQLMLRGGFPYLFMTLLMWYKAGVNIHFRTNIILVETLQISLITLMLGMVSEVLSLNIFYIVLYALFLFRRDCQDIVC